MLLVLTTGAALLIALRPWPKGQWRGGRNGARGAWRTSLLPLPLITLLKPCQGGPLDGSLLRLQLPLRLRLQQRH